MSRLIDADDFEHRFKKMLAQSFIHSTIGSMFFSCIRSQPTVDPVRHAHWAITTEGYWNEDGDVATEYTILAKAHCSKCGFGFRNGMVIAKNSEENPYLYSKEKAVDWILDFARMEREAIDKARNRIDLPYCGKCGSRMENTMLVPPAIARSDIMTSIAEIAARSWTR